MARTPKRLGGPSQLPNAAADFYTAPALTTTEIRYIKAVNTTGTPRTVTISIGADAAGTRIWGARNVPANDEISEPCYFVLAAAEKIQAYAAAASAITLTVSGIENT